MPARIEDYALIGDCRSAALVARDGSIDWLCLPHFSAPSIFAALLDEARGGRFLIRPVDEFRSTRRYIEATAVLETTFDTASGSVCLTDAAAIANTSTRLQPMRELLRVVQGTKGRVALEIFWEPRPNYARNAVKIEQRYALGWACQSSDELHNLCSEAPLELMRDKAAVAGRIDVGFGERIRFTHCYTKGDIGVFEPLGAAADERLKNTVEWWKRWSSRCTYEGPCKDAVLRSAITLKLMTFAMSGAVIAAPTTSLPEVIAGDSNWDYRYCWLRDVALAMRAFTGLGYEDEASAFLRWLLHSTRLTWPELQVAYDIYGEAPLDERALDHFSGYRHSRPVRIGNQAHRQTQLDVYGGVIYAAYDYVRKGGRLQQDEAKLLAGLGKTILRKWREPDHGIWEIRGAPRDYTFSKVMCWVGLNCLISLRDLDGFDMDVDRLRRERDEIGQAIEGRGFNAQLASYVSELNGDRLDAALLVMCCLGYQDADSPRMVSTFERIQERLGHDGLLYRYEPAPEAQPRREGAFGVCSFWAIENMARRSDVDGGLRQFERLLAYCNDVGLYAEQIDPTTGAALGNFPQAFTHIGLISAAIALASSENQSE